MASSLLFLSGGAAAQRADQPDARNDAAAPSGPRDTRLESRRSGMGRDQFIAPVMGIQIEGEGLNLPPEAPEDDPAKAAAKPAADRQPGETKSEPARSIAK